jgi:NitT/TauT family transport system permease protein
MPEAVVEVQGLVRSFPFQGGQARVLDGVDLEVHPGDRVCLVGPNGSGKSTLLRILAGLDRLDGGRVRTSESGGGPYLVPQESDLFPWLTARDNLLLGMRRSALAPAEYVRRLDRWLRTLDLADHVDRFPAQLSGGQRQQFSILRAFLSGSPVLLMDEPFSRLDAATRGHLQQETLELWERERPAIVFVTHDLAEAMFMGERLILMDGRGRARELVMERSGSRDPWNAGGGSQDPAVQEVLAAFREPRPANPSTPSRSAGVTRPALATLLSPLVALLLWEVAARLGWIDTRFFPGPLQVLSKLMEMTTSGELWPHLAASALRLAAGFTLGSLAGTVLGLSMGMMPRLRAVLEPVVALTYPIPKIAILPLLLLIFGLGEIPRVTILAIGAFYLVLLNTLQGVTEARDSTSLVARNLRLRGWDYAVRTLLLGAMPWILTGVRAAAGYCLVLMVAAEFAATESGIGYVVWNSWDLFDIDRMYAGLVVLAVAGALLQALVGALCRAWSRRRGGVGAGGDTMRL